MQEPWLLLMILIVGGSFIRQSGAEDGEILTPHLPDADRVVSSVPIIPHIRIV